MDYTPAWNLYFKTGGSQNWSRYSSPEFDKLLDELNNTVDNAKLDDVFKRGMDLLDQDAPFFVTGFTAHSPMWRNNVKGLALDKRVHVGVGPQRDRLAGRVTVLVGTPGVHTYLLRRALLSVPTLIGVTVLIFVAMRVIPGDPIAMITSESGLNYALSDEEINAVRHSLGLDKPVLRAIPGLDGRRHEGRSGLFVLAPGAHPRPDPAPRRRSPSRSPRWRSRCHGSSACPVGILSAVNRNRMPDYLSRVLVIFFVAIPSFWLALLVVLAGVLMFNWRPSLTIVYFWEDPVKNLEMVLGPAIVLGLGVAALTARMTRSATLEILHEDFVRTARAKGLRERLVVARHVLRNALLPVITISGLAFGALLGGSVAVERAFGVPGLGTLLVMAFGERDWMMIQNLVLIYGVVFTIINLLIDLTYGLLDPRIGYS